MPNAGGRSCVVLPGQRKLAYAEYGDPDGKPVFHFNGSGGSRLDWPGSQTMLRELGIRFISTDRPGHGHSDPVEHRHLLDWPRNISVLADKLGIDRFYVEGWSAGGAYALACAHELPHRVIACATLGGVAPPDRPHPLANMAPEIASWMRNAREAPELVLAERRRLWEMIKGKSAADVGAMLVASLPGDGTAADDRTVLESADLQALLGANVKEGYRQGPDGPLQDDMAVNGDWGLALEDITIPVIIWQGAQDLNVPLVQGTFLHQRIPNSEIIVLPGTAHLFPLLRWNDILRKLTSASDH